MQHDGGLTQIAIVVVVALLCGLGFTRLRHPPILGYILTGIVLGPSGLALIESRYSVEGLAELGMLLLLFVIGMELNLRILKKVWPVAVLCTVLQIAVFLGISWFLGRFFSWTVGMMVLIAFIAAISSTAVVFKMLGTLGELKTETGHLTIAILIAQDLAIVPMILILKNLQTGQLFSYALIIKVLIALGFVVALTIYLTRRQRIHMPLTGIIAKEKELIPIAVLTFCFGAASLTGILGLSAAYGAFLAGLILGNTHERILFFETIKPIQSTLLMVFFLSVGLLLDVDFLWRHLGTVLSLLVVITLAKTAINVTILHFLQVPWSQAFLIGVILAQLGEFAFLLAAIGSKSGLVNDIGRNLIISLTVLSLLLSPIWLTYARKMKAVADQRTIDAGQSLSIHWVRRYWRRLKGNPGFFDKANQRDKDSD